MAPRPLRSPRRTPRPRRRPGIHRLRGNRHQLPNRLARKLSPRRIGLRLHRSPQPPRIDHPRLSDAPPRKGLKFQIFLARLWSFAICVTYPPQWRSEQLLLYRANMAAACQTGGRLALIERCRASGRARRRPRERRAAPRPLRRRFADPDLNRDGAVCQTESRRRKNTRHSAPKASQCPIDLRFVRSPPATGHPQIPIDRAYGSSALPTRGFVLGRLSNAGPNRATRSARARGRRPKPFTLADFVARMSCRRWWEEVIRGPSHVTRVYISRLFSSVATCVIAVRTSGTVAMGLSNPQSWINPL